MSMQAVGWLSSKFGLNIGGRSGGPDPLSESPQEGGEHSHGGDSSGMMFGESSSPFTSRPETGTGEGYFSKERAMEAKDKAMSMASDLGTKIAPLWGQVNNQARSLWDRGLRRTNNSASDPFATGPVSDGRTAFMTDDTAGYNTEVDENGLPVSKDWYYFDSTLNRWAVDPSAPPSVRAAFEQQLLEEEARQQSVGTGAPPPLPPPPPPSMGGGLMGGYGTHRLQGGPQYAVPNYFGSVSPVSQGAQQSSFPPPPVATTALTTTSTMIPPPQPAQPYAQSAFLTNTPPNPAPTQPSPAAQFVRPSASSIASAPMPARLHTTSAPSLYSPPAPTPGATIPLSTTYAAAPPPAGTGVVPSTQTYAAHAPAPASLYPPAHQRSASGPSSVPSPAGLFGPNLTSSSSSNQLGPMGGTYPSAPPAAAPSPAFTYAAPSQVYASSPSGLYPTAQTNNLPSAYPAYQPPTTMALTTPSHAAPPPPPPAFKPFQPS